jgi:hypothetical protein
MRDLIRRTIGLPVVGIAALGTTLGALRRRVRSLGLRRKQVSVAEGHRRPHSLGRPPTPSGTMQGWIVLKAESWSGCQLRATWAQTTARQGRDAGRHYRPGAVSALDAATIFLKSAMSRCPASARSCKRSPPPSANAARSPSGRSPKKRITWSFTSRPTHDGPMTAPRSLLCSEPTESERPPQ